MRKLSTALLVDDDAAFRLALSGALRRRSIKALTAATVEEGLAVAADQAFDLVVLDHRMPGRDGLSSIARFRRHCADSVIIMLTGFGDIPLTVAAMREGADTLLEKPVDADRLLREAHALRERPSERPAQPTSQRSYKLEDIEKETIDAALRDSGGVVAAAARMLGIDRRTLQRKLKKLG